MPDPVQTPPGTVTTDQPIDFLIDQVCAMIGRSKDPELRSFALTALDRAADDLNGAGVFLFRQKEASFSTFTSGQATLTKPSDWAWPTDPAFCYDTNGNILNRMEWKTWDVFEGTLTYGGMPARPLYLSLRSPLDDEIYVSPTIDPTTLASIKIAYLARIQRPSEATNSTIKLTPEAREALIRGGEAYAMRTRYAKYAPIWTPFWAQFKEAILTAQAADRRWLAATHPSAVPEMMGQISYLPVGNRPGTLIMVRVG